MKAFLAATLKLGISLHQDLDLGFFAISLLASVGEALWLKESASAWNAEDP